MTKYLIAISVVFVGLFAAYVKGKNDCEQSNQIESQQEKIIYQDKVIYVQGAQKKISQLPIPDDIESRERLMQWLEAGSEK